MSLFRRNRAKATTEGLQIRELREFHNLALQVFTRRSARGWSQEQLADEAGMTQPQIANIEAGQANPTARTLIKLAAALGCTVYDLWSPVSRVQGEGDEAVSAEQQSFLHARNTVTRILSIVEDTGRSRPDRLTYFPEPVSIGPDRRPWDRETGEANVMLALIA